MWINRKSAPGVKAGRVQRKNRSARTPYYPEVPGQGPAFVRERPGAGYRHLLLVADVKAFVELIPGWAELSRGLRAVMLVGGDPECFGWHTPGFVALCAWPRTLWVSVNSTFFGCEQPLLDRLGVERVAGGDDAIVCRFTEAQASAWQLLSTLLHELGHHHDRMSTRPRNRTARGEPYAEAFAHAGADVMFERYAERFGMP